LPAAGLFPRATNCTFNYQWQDKAGYGLHVRRGGIFLSDNQGAANQASNPAASHRWKYTQQLAVFILIVAVGGLWIWWVNRGDWAVRVNGRPIYNSEITAETDRGAAYYATNYGIDLNSGQGKSMASQIKNEVRQELIDRALLCQVAAKAGIRVSQSEVDAQLNSDMVSCGGKTQFEALLKQQGLTTATYRSQVKELLLINKLESVVTANVTVSEKDLKQYYEANKQSLVNPAQVKVGHILLKDKATAEKVIAELNKGADFEAMVKKYSIDTSKSSNNGVLGYISAGDQTVPEAFLTAAFDTAVGSYTKKPVQTSYGYHIIYVYDKKAAGQASFDSVKAQLLQQVTSDKKNTAFMAYLKRARSCAAYIYPGK
jgi:foldase protein PrsA